MIMHWRKHVCSMLLGHPEFCVVGEVGDGLEAVQHAQELNPHLILLDIGLPGVSGLEAAKRILLCAPGTLIIFLTQNDDREVMRAARGDGARGYVLKINAATELLSAIYTVLAGNHFFGSGVASD
jgi:DNA-binding NarL/FixJ family response regulator